MTLTEGGDELMEEYIHWNVHSYSTANAGTIEIQLEIAFLKRYITFERSYYCSVFKPSPNRQVKVCTISEPV